MQYLQAGKLLRQYKVVKVLGSGGFSVVYLAQDETLNKLFAIKEYFPEQFAHRRGATVRANSSEGDNFTWGKARFLDEAKVLARFDHPNIVKVIQIFEANNTAYMVLEYLGGRSFKSWLSEIDGTPNQTELDSVVEAILSALEVIHRNELLHRDIAPDNIYIKDDGTPVLLDFGSAKEAVGQRTKTISAVVKDGYSPIEQYSTQGSGQGPWSDIYALSATLYHAISGIRPEEATQRMLEDHYVPAKQAAKIEYRPAFLDAIDGGLKTVPKDRPQSIIEWRTALFGERQKNSAASSPIDIGSAGPIERSEGSSPQLAHKQLRRRGLALAALIVGVWVGIGLLFMQYKTEEPSHGSSESAEEQAQKKQREASDYHEARGDIDRLAGYIIKCKICEFRSAANIEISSLRAQKQKALDKSNDYFSARGNIDRLREYITKCKICEFKPAANSEIAETEQRKALQARREESEYNSARGDVGRLDAYVRSCEICTYKSAALDEIKGANGGPPSFWSHNGSRFALTSTGARRIFRYEAPREDLRKLGVSEGTALFDGTRTGKTYSGTAYVFSQACAPTAYTVTGVVSDDDRTVSLFGQAPLRDAQCRVVSYRDDRLEFAFHDHEDNWGRDVSPGAPLARKPESNNSSQSLQSLARSFIANHLRISEGDPSALLDYVQRTYAVEVDYYGNRITRQKVLEDQQKYVARWQQRSLRPIPERTRIVCDVERSFCDVSAELYFRAYNPANLKTSAGITTLELRVLFSKGVPSIISENGTVTSRKSSSPPVDRVPQTQPAYVAPQQTIPPAVLNSILGNVIRGLRH